MKKKMSKKKLIWISVIVLLTAMLTGCGLGIWSLSQDRNAGLFFWPDIHWEEHEHRIVIEDCQVNKYIVQGINYYADANIINFKNCTFTADAMDGLAELSDVSFLDFEDGTLPPNFDFLTQLPELSVLTIENVEFTGKDMKAFPQNGIRQLTILDCTALEDIGFLKNCTELEAVHLGETQVADISVVKNWKNLESLDLSDTKVTDVSVLSGMEKLKDLYLSGCTIQDLSPVVALTTLEGLHINRCGLTAITEPFQSRRLQNVNISDNSLTDVSGLENLYNIHSLYAANCGLQGDALRRVFECSADGMISLDVSGNPELNLDVLSWSTTMKYLNISGVQTDNLHMIGNMTELYTLRAENCGIENIDGLSAAKNIVHVYLADNEITDLSVFQQLAVQNISIIDLTGNNISDLSKLPENEDYNILVLQGNPISEMPKAQLGGYWLVIEPTGGLIDGMPARQFQEYTIVVESYSDWIGFKQECQNYSDKIRVENLKYSIGRAEVN